MHDIDIASVNDEVFEDVSLRPDEEKGKCSASDEDLETGFLLFSAIIYCPESVTELFELYQFLTNLVANETPRTILQATVNTIKADIVEESLNKRRLNDFYLALETTFHLQFGKILLATVSKEEMQMIMDKEWPFLESYKDNVEACLASENCQDIQDIIKELGKLLNLSSLDPQLLGSEGALWPKKLGDKVMPVKF